MRQKEILIISITIFLTILTWIVADVYHVAVTEKVATAGPAILEQDKIDFDIKIFDELEKRQ